MSRRPSPTIRSERRVRFDDAPADLWATLERVGEYPSWWPWLRRFDGSVLEEGARWSCTVQPPLPYRVSFALVLRDLEPGRSVAADLTGDIAGTAQLHLTAADDGGTDLHLVSELAPMRPMLRALSRLASAIPRYGHDQILDRGLAQFVARRS